LIHLLSMVYTEFMDDYLRNPLYFGRFFAKVLIDPDGCWRWQGSRDTGGYGNFFAEDKSRKAHRLTYRHFCGEIPEGMDVMHICDVRTCVNPAHLEVGTRQDNMADCSRKGCAANVRFKPKDALRIRELCELGISQAEIARQFGISQATVSRIRRRERWKHV